MTPDQPWMWPMGGMWIFPMIMFVIMIIILFVFLGRWSRPPWWGPGEHHRESRESETALEILKKRYVKGEVTKEEFEQMKKDLLS